MIRSTIPFFVTWILMATNSVFSQFEGSGLATGPRYALAIHGGAGVKPASLSSEKRAAIESSMRTVGELGQRMLKEGRSAMEVVEAVVRVLEDDPLFNAGRGAVFNQAGGHELDASIMDGKTKRCGAVAGVRTVKNPVTLARLVMEKTPHVLLATEGAEQFAIEMQTSGIDLVENEYFSTPWRREELKKAQDRQQAQIDGSRTQGTVGCVALDRHGNLAAATSTGGLTNKRYGRVGDSPIIGAGTYADNATCAVSCTGTGEYFIRHAIAFHVAALVAYQKLTVPDAIDHLLANVLPNNIGGIIAVGADGTCVCKTNTQGMPFATVDSSGQLRVGI